MKLTILATFVFVGLAACFAMHLGNYSRQSAIACGGDTNNVLPISLACGGDTNNVLHTSLACAASTSFSLRCNSAL